MNIVSFVFRSLQSQQLVMQHTRPRRRKRFAARSAYRRRPRPSMCSTTPVLQLSMTMRRGTPPMARKASTKPWRKKALVAALSVLCSTKSHIATPGQNTFQQTTIRSSSTGFGNLISRTITRSGRLKLSRIASGHNKISRGLLSNPTCQTVTLQQYRNTRNFRNRTLLHCST